MSGTALPESVFVMLAESVIFAMYAVGLVLLKYTVSAQPAAFAVLAGSCVLVAAIQILAASLSVFFPHSLRESVVVLMQVSWHWILALNVNYVTFHVLLMTAPATSRTLFFRMFYTVSVHQKQHEYVTNMHFTVGLAVLLFFTVITTVVYTLTKNRLSATQPPSDVSRLATMASATSLFTQYSMYLFQARICANAEDCRVELMYAVISRDFSAWKNASVYAAVLLSVDVLCFVLWERRRNGTTGVSACIMYAAIRLGGTACYFVVILVLFDTPLPSLQIYNYVLGGLMLVANAFGITRFVRFQGEPRGPAPGPGMQSLASSRKDTLKREPLDTATHEEMPDNYINVGTRQTRLRRKIARKNA